MSGDVCECRSGEPYVSCCGPYHSGARAPESPSRVLRTRFCAFVRGDANYLARTAMGFEGDVEALRAELARDAKRGRVFRAFRVLDAREEDATGSAELLYFVEVKRRGKDASFVEHAFFAREGEGFVYAGGEVMSPPSPRSSMDGWTIAGLPRAPEAAGR